MADSENTPTDTQAEAQEAEQDAPVEAETTDDAPIVSEDDWKTKARKHERDLGKANKALVAAEKKLKEREDADRTDQEKAIEAARQEGANEANNAARTRLLRAEIKAAAAGKFADPTDAVALLSIDADDAFDEDGEIRSDVITEALTELLEVKPHLAEVRGKRPPSGDADGGKGSGGSKSLEDMSLDDHFEAVKRR